MMKGLIIALALTMTAPLVFASNGSHSSRSERYELCYVDGSARMLQPNMCYALGGKRAL
ncbi:hypothetical protein JCM19232_4562 [Vibrio ishigakensis]|uniref:Uncharacterized protein n=1 Tax=Vibrio ishigakensis TaxID=1481914 RepID=A0A0B8P7S4_9VIBR|nr:hypothetical protein [Vibrio ishigakensis]GAM62885.1 hypothetical protein JCM19232_4562 [Vibrio ishigakensis]GAM70411.1 hypothetical protein JCM19236_549 [Vibrio sp. JCM 19236]GAM73693.1 hypothetical protein JCM19241_3148 [Vibrio ishigakensis]